MDLEHDFAAWTDRRDPEALARVFDATAGRLLVLAVHLAGSGASAEDLVQTTFLHAMGRAATWDRERPLWPWLAAILHNEAQMHWRRLRRRREVGIEGAAGATVAAPDPAMLAASDEAFDAVLQAIDALPLRYRQVLRLRLVHGLQPIEIARALEVPVGTVRAQVHRGLQRLRNVLPAGVAGVAGVWLGGDGVLLEQVRAHVLGQAAAVHSAAVAAPVGVLLTGGWWTMNAKTWSCIAAGAVLALCLAYLLAVSADNGSRAPNRDTPPPMVADLDAATQGAETESPATPSRRAPTAAPGPAWPLEVTVRTTGGQPMAGVGVRVWVAARGMQIENQRQGEGLCEEVANGETSSEGLFRCALDAFRARSVLFRRTRFVFVAMAPRAGRAMENVLALPRTTEPQAFATEFEVTPAVGIVGRVVDSYGTPIRGAELACMTGESEHLDRGGWRSRDDGTFCIPISDERPSWPDRVIAVEPRHGTAIAAVPPPEAMPAAGATVEVGTLVLAGRDAIRGQVLLGDGSAVGGFPLFVAEIDPELAGDDPAAIERSFHQPRSKREALVLHHGRPVQVVSKPITQDDGSFVCAGLDPDAVYAVALRDSRMRYSLAVARPGDEPVRLVVERQLLSLDVRSDAGETLQGLFLVAEGRPERAEPGAVASVRNPPYSADARGRLMLLSPFGWTWRIGVQDEAALPDALQHDVIAGVYRAERTLVLRPETRFGSLHLVVVDEHDQPLPRYGAYLRCLDRDLENNDARMIPPAGGRKWELPAGRWHIRVLLGKEVIYAPALQAHARGFHEEEVMVEHDRTTELKIVAKPAGLVSFRLRSESRPEGGRWRDLKIRVEPGVTELPFLGHGEDRRYVDTRVYGSLFVGKQAFAPGVHAFVITADGYHPARCEIEVAADELTRADVELFRQQ